MWQRPSFDELLACLKSLERKPLTWKAGRRETVDDDGPAEEEYARVNERAELARYLSSIIKSPLEWIYDDEQKDAIWTEASRRISERSGRGGEYKTPSQSSSIAVVCQCPLTQAIVAMGDMIRTWPFEPQSKDPFELTIKEPALTGHLLGFKTWGSSYRLALELERLAATSLSGALPGHLPDASRPRVLELGSGTGLLGLAAAAIWETHVALTDLPDILPNLAANAERNRDVLASRGGSVDVGTLIWGDSQGAEADEELFGVPHQFKVLPRAPRRWVCGAVVGESSSLLTLKFGGGSLDNSCC